MTNYGVMLVAFILLLAGMGCSVWNSFLIMSMIGATSFMWVLWWGGMASVIVGALLTEAAK